MRLQHKHPFLSCLGVNHPDQQIGPTPWPSWPLPSPKGGTTVSRPCGPQCSREASITPDGDHVSTRTMHRAVPGQPDARCRTASFLQDSTVLAAQADPSLHKGLATVPCPAASTHIPSGQSWTHLRGTGSALVSCVGPAPVLGPATGGSGRPCGRLPAGPQGCGWSSQTS